MSTHPAIESPMAAEAELVLQARNGDLEARESLARALRAPAFGLALQLVGRVDEARDLAQESLLRFFATFERFDVRRQVRPWLFQIVRNRARDLARRQHLRRVSSLEGLLEEGAAEPVAPTRDPMADAERRELQETIWRALGEVSEAHREILVLRDYQDLSYAEIAEILAIPRGTVMSRLHSARQELRRRLTGGGTRLAPKGGRR